MSECDNSKECCRALSRVWVALGNPKMNDKDVAENVADLRKENMALREASTKWPRCCDIWQDSMGGMHCTECGQKTFSMMFSIQKLLGVNKNGERG